MCGYGVTISKRAALVIASNELGYRVTEIKPGQGFPFKKTPGARVERMEDGEYILFLPHPDHN